MVGFLAFLVIGGVAAMGIGALAALVFYLVRWLLTGWTPMWQKWKEIHGYYELEFIEHTMDEIDGTPTEREMMSYLFGPSAGCLALLLVLPMQLIINPIGWLILRQRKSALRLRMRRLSPEQQAMIAPEYKSWLGV